jgi:hypothetical protein
MIQSIAKMEKYGIFCDVPVFLCNGKVRATFAPGSLMSKLGGRTFGTITNHFNN